MSEIRISFDGERAIGPGSEISGQIDWNVTELPESVHVRLFWYTAGKGDRDLSIVDETSLQTTSMSGNLPFRFKIPEGPYSFDGKLISLTWAVEAIVEPHGTTAREELTVGPGGRGAVIGQPEVD